MHVTVISFSKHITSLLSFFHILSLIIHYNFSCPLFITRYIMFCQWFIFILQKKIIDKHQHQEQRWCEFMIVIYRWIVLSNYFHITRSFHYITCIWFIPNSYYHLRHFSQVSTSIYWFNTFYPMQTFMLAELFRRIGISGRSISPNTANMQC